MKKAILLEIMNIKYFYFTFILNITWVTLLQFIEATDTNKKLNPIAWSKLNLPPNHMPYFFKSNQKLRKLCIEDEKCPFRDEANSTEIKCWGYEANCNEKSKGRLFLPECPGDSRGWV